MVDEKKLAYKNIVLAVHIIVFITLIILGYYAMLYNEKRDGIIRNGKASAEDTADKFNDYMATSIGALKLTADGIDHMLAEARTNADIVEYVVSQSTAVKNAVSENFTGIYGCIRGEFVSGTRWVPEPGYNAKERPWYIRGMEGKGEVSLLEPYLDVQTGKNMLAVVKMLGDGDSVVGVDISLDEIQKITEKAVSDGVSDMEMIFDTDNCVVAHSDKSQVGQNYDTSDKDSFEYKLAHAEASPGKSYIEMDYKGTQYIIYQASIAKDWRALSVRNATIVFAPLLATLLGTIIVVVIMVIVLSLVFKKINKKSIEASRAIAASEAKSAFLSNMSHEIRTPINAIIGMNEMILREAKDEDIKEYSEKIKSAGDSLLGLVNEMLDFSENAGLSENDRKRFTAKDAHILVVDDNPVNLMVFQNLLKKTKINIDAAGSGAEGLELAKAKKYDLIFFDHMMPEMDGIETLHRLRAYENCPNENTKVICLTANVIPGAKDHYLSQGFDNYLTKPVDPAVLEEMVLSYLDPEKVTMIEETEAENATEEDKILDFIKTIPEINVEAGIRNNGGREAFLETLTVYARTAEKNRREIKEYVEGGDIKNATIKIHALKSTSRIIGAADLGDLAQTLENAGKEGEENILKFGLPELLERYGKLGESLSPLLEEEAAGDTGDLPEIGEERFASVMERIAEYAGDCDNVGIDEMLEDIKKYRLTDTQSDLVSDISQAIMDFDFDKVSERVKNG